MGPNDGPEPLREVIDLTLPEPQILPSELTVIRTAKQVNRSLGHSLSDAKSIAMSSDETALFRPPAFTLDLFKEYVAEDDEKSIEGKPEGSTQKTASRNYDGDAVGVFALRNTRPRPFRPNPNLFATTSRVPTLTQQGRRLPKDLRIGYRRGQQDIISRGETYEDTEFASDTSRRVSTASYGRVHTALPATNLIPAGGGGYLATNSFMTSAQRKRLEQQDKLEKTLADLEECVAAFPTDVKLQGKLLHLRTLQHRLEQDKQTILKGAEVSLIKEVERMLSRRRMKQVEAEFENQAKAMVEDMSSAGTKGWKRAYGQGIGVVTPLSSNWSETAAPSERSSFSRPSTGGKTVPPAYYQRHKKRRTTYGLEDTVDADDEFQNGDDDEDVVWDERQERKSYGSKTISPHNMASISDEEMAKLLMDAVEEESGDKRDESGEEDSDDDADGTSDDNTD